MAVGVAHVVAAVVGADYYKVIVVIGTVVEAVDSGEEVAVALVVLVFHVALVGDAVVVPRTYEYGTLFLWCCKTEGDAAVGVLNSSHLGYTSGVNAGFGRTHHGVTLACAESLTSSGSGSHHLVVACVFEFVFGCKLGNTAFRCY